MILGHGGNLFEIATKIGCRPEDIVDFSSNMNPVGPPSDLVDFLKESLSRITYLPDPGARPAITAFSKYYHLSKDEVIAGNGTTQLIYDLPLVLGTKKALIVNPTYSDYADACRINRVPHDNLYLPESSDFTFQLEDLKQVMTDADTVFICNPNNPTGRIIPKDCLDQLSRQFPLTRFVIDESYLPFVNSSQGQSFLSDRPTNVLVLHSLSKIFKIPGLRIGFLIAAAEILDKFRAFQKPWSVNGLAQAAVEYLSANMEMAEKFISETRAFISKERALFVDRLHRDSAIKIIPSDTVFMLARLPEDQTAFSLKTRLLNDKVLIRDCSNFDGLDRRYFRISLKSTEFNRNLAEKLIHLFPRAHLPRTATMTHATHSIGQTNDC
jgi:threonine-phosphate decarboxylase